MNSQHTFRALAEQLHPYLMAERWVVAPLFENIQYFAVSLGIILGSILVSWIVYKLILFFGLPRQAQRKFRVIHGKSGERRVERHDRSGRVRWDKEGGDIESQELLGKHYEGGNDHVKPPFYSPRSSAVHFTAIIVKYGIILFGFYFGFGVSGLNFFNMAFGLGIVGICATYGGASVLSNAAGTLVTTGTGDYTEGMVIMVGADKGEILTITNFFTFLKCRDKETGKFYTARVPNHYMNDITTRRYEAEEAGMDDADVQGISMRVSSAAGGGAGGHQILKQRL